MKDFLQSFTVTTVLKVNRPDWRDYFPSFRVHLDNAIGQIMRKTVPDANLTRFLLCNLYEAKGGEKVADLLQEDSGNQPSLHFVQAVLQHLSTRGRKLLDIPADKDSLTILIAPFQIDQEKYVFGLERSDDPARMLSLRAFDPEEVLTGYTLVLQIF